MCVTVDNETGYELYVCTEPDAIRKKIGGFIPQIDFATWIGRLRRLGCDEKDRGCRSDSPYGFFGKTT